METLLNQSCGFFMPNAKTERLVSGIIADFLLQRLIAVCFMGSGNMCTIFVHLHKYLVSITFLSE